MKAFQPLIAIVDDEVSVRKAYGRLLRLAGMEVCLFGSGADFLAAVEECKPDCVVLDLHMPEISGFEVMERSSWGCPVIFMTGDTSLEAETRARASGAAAYLRKPIDDGVLLGAITDAIAHPTSSKPFPIPEKIDFAVNTNTK